MGFHKCNTESKWNDGLMIVRFLRIDRRCNKKSFKRFLVLLPVSPAVEAEKDIRKSAKLQQVHDGAYRERN